jgi:CRISPR/Cas system-associated protein Cas5 (RAMP superfamily)
MEAVPASEGGSSDHRRSSYGREYWLRRCEGFLVETSKRRIGRVDGIRYGKSQNEPEAIAVRAGRFGRRLLLVSVEDVERIDAEQRRIVVADSTGLQPG